MQHFYDQARNITGLLIPREWLPIQCCPTDYGAITNRLNRNDIIEISLGESICELEWHYNYSADKLSLIIDVEALSNIESLKLLNMKDLEQKVKNILERDTDRIIRATHDPIVARAGNSHMILIPDIWLPEVKSPELYERYANHLYYTTDLRYERHVTEFLFHNIFNKVTETTKHLPKMHWHHWNCYKNHHLGIEICGFTVDDYRRIITPEFVTFMRGVVDAHMDNLARLFVST